MSKSDYLSNVSNVIKGENHHMQKVKTLLPVPKHPDAAPKGLRYKVLSISLVVMTNREILAEAKSFWRRPNMPEGFL